MSRRCSPSCGGRRSRGDHRWSLPGAGGISALALLAATTLPGLLAAAPGPFGRPGSPTEQTGPGPSRPGRRPPRPRPRPSQLQPRRGRPRRSPGLPRGPTRAPRPYQARAESRPGVAPVHAFRPAPVQPSDDAAREQAGARTGGRSGPVREPARRRPRDARADRPGRRLRRVGAARRDRRRQDHLRGDERHGLAGGVRRVPANRRTGRRQIRVLRRGHRLHVGQTVHAGQPIAQIIAGDSGGIEIGWGSGVGTQPLAQALGEWSGGDDANSVPSAAGKDFSALIAQLGGPPGKVEG